MIRNVPLRAHPYCQCHVSHNSDGSIDFTSYSTRVISVKFQGGKRMVECTGTYSPATSRQITYFLREYAPDLSLRDMKKIISRGFIAC